VIFLEIPSSESPDTDKASKNLESRAVRLYRDSHDVALVPVDRPTPDPSFFSDAQYLDRRVVATNPTYSRLVDQNSYDIATYGFPYLNSERCSQAWADIYDAMHIAVQRLKHDIRLSAIFEAWKGTIDRRDREMLRGMDDWSLRTSFEVGALLVGAAHRRPLLNKAKGPRGAAAPRIEPAVF
jgi:hypothetical protein